MCRRASINLYALFLLTFCMYVCVCVCVCVCDDIGHKLDMEDESSRLYGVFPAHRRCLGPVWLPVDISAALRVVFIEAADVAVLRFKVKHRQAGRSTTLSAI